jgi:putative oxidoreductase
LPPASSAFFFPAFGAAFLLNLLPQPPAPPEGSPAALFMGALMPTGYMAFVKVCEILGGILVAIPRTRNWGLLVLGPVIINILAFHVFIMKGAMLLDPVLIVVCLLAAFLLWSERRAFMGLIRS